MINRNILIWWPKNNEIPVLNMIVRIIKLCLVRTTRGNLFLNFETNQDIFQYMGECLARTRGEFANSGWGFVITESCGKSISEKICVCIILLKS